MHPNEALIASFYEAFQRLDADAMGACYSAEVRFSDAAFPQLTGDEARAMWAMLCSRATDLQISFTDVQADDAQGSAHWEATYTFGATGRKVHNRIDASFRFKEGRIVEHTDVFDFWRWSRMALGPVGFLLGWTPMLRRKVRSQARQGLDKWMARSVVQEA